MKHLSIVTILLLSSCSIGGEKLYFSGESDIWHVNYEVKIEADERVSQFIIQYIGNNPAPTKMSFEINGETFQHTGEAQAEKGIKSVNRDGGNCSKCRTIQENKTIVATIRWEGKKEKVHLQPEK